MIGYRLCHAKTAKRPFFVESISVNLYSLEELCYFLEHNLALIDDSIVSPELVRWVGSELGLGETALKMEQALRNEDVLPEFILPLYQDTRYLEPMEIRALERRLDQVSVGPLWVRMKKKADALARNGKLGCARRIYYEALGECEDLLGRDSIRDFHAAVWYQIGVVNMQLFEYEDGCDAFLKSIRLHATKPRVKACMMAMKLTLPSEKYRDNIRELLEQDELEPYRSLQAEAEAAVDAIHAEAPEPLNEAASVKLHELVREYHNSVEG